MLLTVLVSHQYLKKLHTQERAVEEVKLAIKPYYQKKDITKEEYKDILRKAVHKVGPRDFGIGNLGPGERHRVIESRSRVPWDWQELSCSWFCRSATAKAGRSTLSR